MNNRPLSYVVSLVLNGVLIIVAVLLGARIIMDVKTIRELRDEQLLYERALDEELSHDDEAGDEPVVLPVVAFSPAGKFTDAERDLLWQRVITPHTDYSECMSQQVVSILIEEYETPKVIADTTYRYGVTVMLSNPDGTQNAIQESFLHGEVDGELQYWVPDLLFTQCVDVLPNADEVRDRAIDEYNG